MQLYQPTITGSLSVSGSINISGSINVVGGGGTITGTASYASNAELLDGLDSTVFTLTSSFAAFTASQNILNGTYATTSSNTFTGIQTVNSNLVVTGSITAQTLVVQTITSSVDFVTGSTRFGSILGNTHVFSGSVTMNPGGLFVSSSGNVGIGTTTPRISASGTNRTLDIKGGIYFGDTNSESCTINNNDSMIFNIDADNSSTSNFFRFATNTTQETGGTELMRITEAGNVGIGTSTPSQSTIGINRIFEIGGTSVPGIILRSTATTAEFSIGTGGDGLIIAAAGSANAATDNVLRFFTGATNSSYSVSERMRITSEGNVGIGTSSPTNILHISGSGANTQTLVLESSLSSANAYVVVKSASKMYFSGLSTDLSNSFIIYDGTAGVARLAITSAGNVTVGNAAYQGVTTDFSITGDKVNANGYYSRLIFQNSSQSGGSSASIRGERILSNFATELTFYTNINTSAGEGLERMRIKYDGTIQIGSTAGYTTIVQGQFFSKGGGDMLVTNALSGGVARHWALQRNDALIFSIGNDGSDNLAFYNASSTNIGNINKTTGTYTATSDINKKKDIELSTIGLNAILGLKPSLYRMKVDSDLSDKHLGFIAQEVKDYIPQAYQDNGDFIGLDYQPIVATLVKAIQELQAQITELKNK
jgi:hypothetical protein